MAHVKYEKEQDKKDDQKSKSVLKDVIYSYADDKIDIKDIYDYGVIEDNFGMAQYHDTLESYRLHKTQSTLSEVQEFLDRMLKNNQ